MFHIHTCLYAYQTAISARIEAAIEAGDDAGTTRVLTEMAAELERAAAELAARADRIRNLVFGRELAPDDETNPPWNVSPPAR